jgi:hypothetical protein
MTDLNQMTVEGYWITVKLVDKNVQTGASMFMITSDTGDSNLTSLIYTKIACFHAIKSWAAGVWSVL